MAGETPVARDAEGRPLVMHVVYRFATGGLENGVVNLINHMPPGTYRHAIVAVTEVDDGFAQRIRRRDVDFLALHKPPGHGVGLYPRFLRLLRSMQPAIVHTRNLAALEYQVPAWWARIPARIHGEHGRDLNDPLGLNRRYQWMRRLYRPFVQQYVALSKDLAEYLVRCVHVPRPRVNRICNGVDTRVFRPADGARAAIDGCPFTDTGLFIVGSVGRMQAVKGPLELIAAFARALELRPQLRERLRLVMAGDGPLHREALQSIRTLGLDALVWLPGERADVPAIMRGLDCFVLPSHAEGISNTILEAMASGLPIIARDVGGNAELVDSGRTGLIVPARDEQALAAALAQMAQDDKAVRAMGQAGRDRAEREFSLDAMVGAYASLYDRMLGNQQT